MGRKTSVAVISSAIGKTPKDIAYSFIFDEVYQLVQNGIKVHVITSKIEKKSLPWHSLLWNRKEDRPQALNMVVRNFTSYPTISLLRRPTTLYWKIYTRLRARHICPQP